MTSRHSRSEENQQALDHREKWEFMMGVSIFLMIVIGLAFGSYQLLRVITDENQVPLEGLILQGQLMHTTEEEIRSAILSGEVGSFFTADVDDIRARIEALPWIFSASIRKEWPGRLRVFVVEQDPIAIWNDGALINVYGQIFFADPKPFYQVLPELLGPDHAHQDVLEQFQQMRDLLRIAEMEIIRVQLSERYSLQVWLAQDIELRLGREARLERIQRFMDVYPLIIGESSRPVEYADLRYDTGIAIGWRTEQKK